MNPAEFITEFREEASEKLDAIASQLLRFEREPSNPQAVREMFLAAHTIKGGASMLRLTAIQELAHGLEDVLASFRDHGRTLDRFTADRLFQTIDRLRELVQSASPAAVGAEVDPQLQQFVEQLRAESRSVETAAAPVEQPGPVELLPAGAQHETAAAQAPRPRRALVVDGSATVRELHAYLLRKVGYEVDCVADGDEALSRALRADYALVVAGLELDGLSGLELTRSLRLSTGYAGVPIVLVTADIDAERCQLAVQAGAQTLLRKCGYADEQLTRALAELDTAQQPPATQAA
jgi:chemotaxis protein histidine kinase CheA